MGVPQNGWFIRKNPIKIKMDDLGVPLFQETSIWLINLDYKSTQLSIGHQFVVTTWISTEMDPKQRAAGLVLLLLPRLAIRPQLHPAHIKRAGCLSVHPLKPKSEAEDPI